MDAEILKQSLEAGYARAFQSIVEDQKKEIALMQDRIFELKEALYKAELEINSLKMYKTISETEKRNLEINSRSSIL